MPFVSNRIKFYIYKIFFYYYDNFPIKDGKSFLGRVLFKTLGSLTCKIAECKMELYPESFIDSHLIKTGTFDASIHRYIESKLKDGGIFVDIGANIGFYSLVAAKLPDVTVLAFEPSARELSRLNKNIALNGLRNIKVYPFGLSSFSGSLPMSISSFSNAGLNSFINPITPEATETVRVERLDSIIDGELISRIKLMKIDVEGFELEVLKGMEKILEEYQGEFIIEITNRANGKEQPNGKEIYSFLKQFGFTSAQGWQAKAQYDDIFFRSPGSNN